MDNIEHVNEIMDKVNFLMAISFGIGLLCGLMVCLILDRK